jgi:hypothetical protein
MADRDELPIFRPKLGKRERAGQRAAPANFRNAVLANLRGMSSCAKARRSTMGRARIAVRPSVAWSRRVTVKVHVAPLRAGGAKAAALHLRYIERDGVEKDGSRGVLYGSEGSVDARTFEAPRFYEKHQFRLIVSPEDAGELDLNLYVRRFMSQIEQDLGQRLEWAAVNHFDTDHPHAHVIVRGVDRDHREVRLPRAYVAHGLRDRAQQIATEELGPRPEQDLARQRQREVRLERFTTIDRQLERRAVGERVEIRRGMPGRAAEQEALLASRLRHPSSSCVRLDGSSAEEIELEPAEVRLLDVRGVRTFARRGEERRRGTLKSGRRGGICCRLPCGSRHSNPNLRTVRRTGRGGGI